jgi:hypothetical protein
MDVLVGFVSILVILIGTTRSGLTIIYVMTEIKIHKGKIIR